MPRAKSKAGAIEAGAPLLDWVDFGDAGLVVVSGLGRLDKCVSTNNSGRVDTVFPLPKLKDRRF